MVGSRAIATVAIMLLLVQAGFPAEAYIHHADGGAGAARSLLWKHPVPPSGPSQGGNGQSPDLLRKHPVPPSGPSHGGNGQSPGGGKA
jgi:hypothetical protein